MLHLKNGTFMLTNFTLISLNITIPTKGIITAKVCGANNPLKTRKNPHSNGYIQLIRGFTLAAVVSGWFILGKPPYVSDLSAEHEDLNQHTVQEVKPQH